MICSCVFFLVVSPDYLECRANITSLPATNEQEFSGYMEHWNTLSNAAITSYNFLSKIWVTKLIPVQMKRFLCGS